LKKYVAYYRVSTQQQGNSGLGLHAQKETVIKFIDNNTLLAEFTEIESGKNNQRQELVNAIEFANSNQATLIIAKLDRLSRNVSFRKKSTDIQYILIEFKLLLYFPQNRYRPFHNHQDVQCPTNILNALLQRQGF